MKSVLTPAGQTFSPHAGPHASIPGLLRWPDDYIALDDSRLFVRRDYVSVFRELGWRTFDDVFFADCDVFRRVADRENCRLELPHPAGSGTVTSYLKRHRSRRPSEWLAAQFRGRAWRAPGMAEADAVGCAQRGNVPTMHVIAAGQRPGSRPWEADSLFLSEAIRDGIPADDFWKQNVQQHDNSSAASSRRLKLIEALAGTARDFHASGLFHSDFYWCHFFVSEPAPDRFIVSLIDLQRVRQSPVWSWRWRLKDLAQFCFSAPPGALTDDEKLHWFRNYLNVESLSAAQLRQLQLIDLRAALYHWKERSR